MNISFRQLRLFLALAETGSITAAARRCHVTQPTASMQIRAIAEAVGAPLHEVVGQRVYLTEVGRDLAATAKAIAREWAAFEQRIDAVKGLTRGKLRIAVVSTAKHFVPRLLGDFCADHPEVDIVLEVLNRDRVVQRLRDNLDDLCIMSMPPSDIDLEDWVFLPNPLVMIAAAAHPLAGRGRLRLDDLAGVRFILREQGSGTRMAVDAHFRQHGYVPDVRMELGSNEAIKEAVVGNLGVAVVSGHTLRGQPGDLGIAILDVEGFPIQSQWHVVHPKGKQLLPVARVFKDYLLTVPERRSASFSSSNTAPGAGSPRRTLR